MTRYIEFTVSRSDFDIDGLFCICEPLEIEFSTELHGFRIEGVRFVSAGGDLKAVPAFISDYIASWVRTGAGRAAIQSAYEAELIKRDDPDNRADSRADHDRDSRLQAAE